MWVDTVPFGCLKELFTKIGLFDEATILAIKMMNLIIE